MLAAHLSYCRVPSPGCVAWLLLASSLIGARPTCGAETIPNFSREILPILSDTCFPCHGPDEERREAELRLDTREGLYEARDAKAVVKPGELELSELFQRIKHADPDQRMPPADATRQLTPQQIQLIRRWIEGGAPWAEHWAFVAPQRPPLPQLDPPAPAANPIDRFVLDRMRREQVADAFAPPADPRSLARRLFLDLTGLPPTREQLAEFLADSSPNAYERLVDRLLASPRFGERMVWEWLDAARYADSNGYQGDGERTMYPWRDWAIDALNRGLPFDQFTHLQLAGDLLPGATDEQRLATGFCRNHMINGEGGRIPDENRVDYVMDMTETVGTVWLGLTFTCARCHDHKYDPLSQRDYYRLFAFFNQTPVDGGGGNPQTPPVLEVASVDQQQRRAELQEQFAQAAKAVDEAEIELFPREEKQAIADAESTKGLPDELKKILASPARNRNREQLQQLEKHWEKDAPEYVQRVRTLRQRLEGRDELTRRIPRVMVMEDRSEPRETFMLLKGLYNKPTEKVTAATPERLPPLPAHAAPNRLALAQWLTAAENPLTARVLVNRIWQQFFGIGLVKTSEDFGIQGEKPSHPELLDWLAVEFRETGWDLKQLCRLIVTSAAYRQSSHGSPELLERDPENRWLARGARYRLPAWMIRDQALATSGLLVERHGGPPVKPYQPEGVWEEATFGKKEYVQDHGAALYRRSVYTFWRRIVGPTMFFDAAARQTCTVKQSRTNTPLHALAILNDVTYVEAARALAERVLNDGGNTAEERIAWAFETVLVRRPSAAEGAVLWSGLERLRRQYAEAPAAAAQLLASGEAPRDERLDPVEHAAYTALCMSLWNLDESLTRE